MLHVSRRLACLCVLLAASASARAAEPHISFHKIFVPAAWSAASEELLGTLRGGYEPYSGLAVSFGFVRSVSINGDRVSQTRFNLPDLAHISAYQARAVSDALTQAMVVQNGLGNSVGSNSLLGAATVVQNSLNNQTIQTLTQIDAGVNTLGLLRSINVQTVLRDALLGAVGTR